MTDWRPKVSVFTPFFRRFADESNIEREETLALYNDARAIPPPDPAETIQRTAEFFTPSVLQPMLIELMAKLVRDETWIFASINFDFSRLNMR